MEVSWWFCVVVAVALCLPAATSMYFPGGNPWEEFARPYVASYSGGGMGNMYRHEAAETEIVSQYKETPEAYVYTLKVPGLKKEDVKVEAEEGVLRIKGEEKKYGRERGEVHWSYGHFWKQFTLADDADVNNIHTDVDHGLLTVAVPKRHHQKKT